VWILLWGEPSEANLASGLLTVAVMVAVDSRLRRPRTHRVHPLAVAVLVADLLGRLVVSSLQVARAVLWPTPARLRAGVVSVPLRTDSPLVATVLADLISLTPGTVTLDVREAPPRLLVHVLGLGDADALVADMVALEARVLRAVDPITTGRPDHRGGAR
jgi:multicomponent Na+:H+ antiporter subunit E